MQKAMTELFFCLLVALLMVAGCSSEGTLGMVTKSSADTTSILKSGWAYKEIGPVRAQSCMHSPFGIAVLGDSDFATVVEEALKTVDGDALLYVTASHSLRGLGYLFTIYAITCTTVEGVAIKFE